MVHATTQQLIRTLHELTEANVLAWQKAEPAGSRLETEGYVVEVEAQPPTLRLLKADGQLLESADADALAAIAWPVGEGTFATRVAEMAVRASRVSQGAEPPRPAVMSALSAPPKAPSLAAPIFGRIEGFVRPAPATRPPPTIRGFSARTVQTTADVYKPWR
jgi:hypothetical protein